MKKYTFLTFFFLMSVSVFAQSGFEVKGYFGVSGALANRKVDLEGASSVDLEALVEVGVLLSKSINKKFSITGGLSYSFAQVKYYPNIPPCFNCLSIVYDHNPDFQMLSIPIYAEYALGKYFYAAAGPILDFQLSEGNNFSDQSGVGYLVGLGGKVDKGNFTFSIFPNYKRHGVIPFDNSPQYKHVLQEFGLQFGVGYIL